MKRIIAGIMFVVCAAALAGCGMMRGAGEDMEEAGKNIQKAADK